MGPVLSIQSAVCAGHVGLGASAFALAAEGIECIQLPTVQLSGHAATPGVRGRRLPGDEIAALGQGLAASGRLGRCAGILSGYPGDAQAAEALADLVAAARQAAPGALYLCDPVLGDDGPGLYLPEAVGRVFRDRLLPMADIAIPNRFELEWLTGLPASSLPEIREAAQALRALGPEVVVVTSVPLDGAVGLATVTAAGASLHRTPMVGRHLHGAGDFVASVLLASLLKGEGAARARLSASAPQAAARAAGAAFALALEAERQDRDDFPIVTAREAWMAAQPAPTEPLVWW